MSVRGERSTRGSGIHGVVAAVLVVILSQSSLLPCCILSTVFFCGLLSKCV